MHEHYYVMRVAHDNLWWETSGTYNECMEWLDRFMRRIVLPSYNNKGGEIWHRAHAFQIQEFRCTRVDCPAYAR